MMKVARNANEFRDRMDKVIRRAAPDDVIAWLDAMKIVSDAWIAGHQRGTDVALMTSSELNEELREGKCEKSSQGY